MPIGQGFFARGLPACPLPRGRLSGGTMKIDTERFRAKEGARIRLTKWPTKVKPVYASKEEYQKILGAHVDELSALQEKLYASNRFALLVIFQAMDAAGKDGAIKHVMSGVNPQGCQVFSYAHPSATELQHDFLWRTSRDLPPRGRIGIFNRSYYEEVLIVRVHPEILQGEGAANQVGRGERIWKERFESIRDIESHLTRSGTRIVKFFLHLSKEEQRKRFLQRIDDPDKNWKLTMADIKERGYWKEYQVAYEKCISATSSAAAPWYIVPADDKANAHLIVSQTIANALTDMGLAYPHASAAHRKELLAVRAALDA
jgi:PPK2 family polyphosphate:nucleotide phosphotransferase